MTHPVAIDAAAALKNYAVTVATPGSGIFGADNSGLGAIAPTSYGSAIFSVSSAATRDFGFSMAANVAQTWCDYLVVQCTDGTWRKYRSADATFAGGTPSTWTWGSGSSKVWTANGSRAFLITPYK